MTAIQQCMEAAVGKGVFPGGVLLVAREDRLIFLEAYGTANLYHNRPMTVDTVFDLASLTKPLATALAVMALMETGDIGLDQAMGEIVPDFAQTGKAHITLRQLLSHSAGLAAYRPYYERLRNLGHVEAKDALGKELLKESLIAEPGTACLYSDIGFMVLQRIIETIAHQPLDEMVAQRIYSPLGLEDQLFFNPLPYRKKTAYAATEDCPWRGKLLEGEVHDDNAYSLGGVSGHAGLFGSARAVYRLLLNLLDTFHGKSGGGPFRRDTVRPFFQRQVPTETWALGFDTPSRPDSSSGRYFSDRSVGHLGFTGTSFWMDLDRKLIVILLTNRVHPNRDNEGIKTFRPSLHDAVMEHLVA